MERVRCGSSSIFHLQLLIQHRVRVHLGPDPKPHTHRGCLLYIMFFSLINIEVITWEIVPTVFFPYPPVGEDRITLLNQDCFDHRCVHYGQHRLPAVEQPCNAITDIVRAWSIAWEMNGMIYSFFINIEQYMHTHLPPHLPIFLEALCVKIVDALRNKMRE